MITDELILQWTCYIIAHNRWRNLEQMMTFMHHGKDCLSVSFLDKGVYYEDKILLQAVIKIEFGRYDKHGHYHTRHEDLFLLTQRTLAAYTQTSHALFEEILRAVRDYILPSLQQRKLSTDFREWED